MHVLHTVHTYVCEVILMFDRHDQTHLLMHLGHFTEIIIATHSIPFTDDYDILLALTHREPKS